MEPENIAPTVSGRKKILIITLAVILVVAGVALGYLFMQKDTSMPPEEVVTVVPEIKISAEDSAKLQILKELTTQTSTTTASQEQKLLILKNLQTKSPATTASDIERIKILQSISAQ